MIAAVALTLGLDWLVTGHQVAGALREIAGVILVVAAIAILLGPWWVRIARDLMVEGPSGLYFPAPRVMLDAGKTHRDCNRHADDHDQS